MRHIATAAAPLGGVWLAPTPQAHKQSAPQGNPMVAEADFKLTSLLLLPCGAELASRDRTIGILPLRLKQGELLRSWYVRIERVSCTGLKVAAGACNVQISHIH